jgi:hypothetical protein
MAGMGRASSQFSRRRLRQVHSEDYGVRILPAVSRGNQEEITFRINNLKILM